MAQKQRLLEEILDMNEKELLEYVTEQSRQLGVDFDRNLLDGTGKQPVYDFIADQIHPELQAELHSEYQETDYDPMHPNETVEEFHEH